MKQKNLTIKNHSPPNKREAPTSWDDVAAWYDGWMGQKGGDYHRQIAIPALLRLLNPQKRETVLDIGAGQGVLAPYLQKVGMEYVGIEASPKLVSRAKKRHCQARFMHGDARALAKIAGVKQGGFDTAVFLLSIQDMDPLDVVLQNASWALKAGGRLVILMTHPCFRIPRQSGWGWDKRRKLRFRRIDSYLTTLRVPLQPKKQGKRSGQTCSFHRPLQAYINGLADNGLFVERIQEIPVKNVAELANGRLKADKRASTEIPLFLGIRARKIERTGSP
ncbi:class I SAM-dependent methyltransferase [Candidatus Leptofilum sp.]|uniref:class I SAM-dependent methyltransferase n=1 Tax=Candidatus Leptofilum sp. TaxID=3241576 RepID=UPI003B5C3D04